MITSIDFEDNLSGFIRNKGAEITQKIPSHRCIYDVENNNNKNLSLSYTCHEDNRYLVLVSNNFYYL